MHLYLKNTKFIYLFNYISQHASDKDVHAETLSGWSVHQLVSIPYDHCTSFCNYTHAHNTANTRITNEKNTRTQNGSLHVVKQVL